MSWDLFASTEPPTAFRFGIGGTLHRGNGHIGIRRSGRFLPCRSCTKGLAGWDGVNE